MRVDPVRRFRENVVGIASLLVTGLWMGLFFTGTGEGLWLAVLIVGYAVVVPLTAILFGDEEDVAEWWDDDLGEAETGSEHEENRDALETLRQRYAAGELTDEQFERKLEALLETETIEDVESRFEAGGAGGNRQRDTDRTLER